MNVASNHEWIPERFLERLRNGHLKGCELLVNSGLDSSRIESVEIAEMVEAHRWAWKPKHVRLLLIAESHVHTQATEFTFDYRRSRHFPNDLNIPARYVRLIYCLGYGEKMLAPDFNGGTPQFWAIFGNLCGTQPKHRRGAPRHERLNEKIRTLKVMAELGIWLVDASFHAISLRKGERLDPELVGKLQRLWWEDYGRTIIDAEQPERIVAIGKGVFSAMQHCMRFNDWIYQPQGVRSVSQQQHNSRVLEDLRLWLLQKDSKMMS